MPRQPPLLAVSVAACFSSILRLTQQMHGPSGSRRSARVEPAMAELLRPVDQRSFRRRRGGVAAVLFPSDLFPCRCVPEPGWSNCSKSINRSLVSHPGFLQSSSATLPSCSATSSGASELSVLPAAADRRRRVPRRLPHRENESLSRRFSSSERCERSFVTAMQVF